ncbi:MAG: trypsin-like peptidase domain-containing protein [Oscillospiraceae bacterium]|nr:trypsin-like peptidase domain-containing protein [Oscillospiraceae bacterium]
MYNPYNENDRQERYESTARAYTPYDSPEPPKSKNSSGMSGSKVVALAVCCSLIGGVVGAGASTLIGGKSDSSMIYQGERETSELSITQVDTSKQLTAAEVYAANVNSTVGITTTSVTTNFWGYQTTQAASGSGFVYTDDGYILTNYHVIQGANAVTVTMYDGTAYDATVIGYDSSNDIAVLKIEAEGLTPVIIGDSDQVNVGDTVVAIGNPLGELTFSLTSGVISALDREVTFSGGTTMDLIQTDCAINSGNSGGALFNLYGEVVGITNAKYSSSGSSSEASIDNIGFAIPISSVRSIVDSVIENGYIAKPYLGISVLTVSESVQSYGLPAGASVQEITAGSPAEKAGLQVNDIITAVNGTEITSSDELVEIVGDSEVGDILELTVYRNGQATTIEITVGENITSMTQDYYSAQQSNSTQQYGQGSNSGMPWGGW